MGNLLLILFGFLIGTIASLTGIGGGAFIVPILSLFYDFVPAKAVGTSLATIIFIATAASLNYAKQKRIYYKIGLILALTAIPGAFFGAHLTRIISAYMLGLIYGFFLIFIALTVLFERNSRPKKIDFGQISKSDNKMCPSLSTTFSGMGLSFFGGLSSGLLGIGGGALFVPIMVFILKMPIHNATATSMFTIMITSLSGIADHYMANHVYLNYAFFLALGAIFGAQMGAQISKKISSKSLRRIFGIVLIIEGIQMIWKYMPR